MTGLTIIIPTYNRAQHLRETLCSVAEMKCPEDVERELLVIDNNCTDDTEQVVEEAARGFPFPLRHIVETQQGLCFGRNRGLAEAQHEHLAYLDDDIRVSPDWISGYFEAVRDHNADAVVGPVFPLFEGEKPDYLRGSVLQSISSSYSRRGEEVLQLPRESAHQLPGCNFGVKREAAREAGGFDNTLDRVGKGLLAGGDFDLGQRLVAAGRHTVYHPDCWIKHVIVPEKLTKPYLRKRAIGLGQTRRITECAELTFWRRTRYLAGLTRIWGESLFWRVTGRGDLSFERELDALKTWGYVNAKVPEDRKKTPSRGRSRGETPGHSARPTVHV